MLVKDVAKSLVAEVTGPGLTPADVIPPDEDLSGQSAGVINNDGSAPENRDRLNVLKETVDGSIQSILERVSLQGWRPTDAIDAMEQVLSTLRVMHSHNDHVTAVDVMDEKSPKDTNEGHAFIHGRD